MDDAHYWLGFSLIPNIGAKRLARLFETFGDLQSAWYAPADALRRAELGPTTLETLLRLRDEIDLGHELARVRRAGAWLLTLADDRYPPALRRLDDPPPLLYVRGTLLPQDERALAIVGTRKASRYGRDVTEDIARQLAAQGVTVISGLAHGIDSAAHHGALAGGGRTIAVLGCGVDVIYPAENRDLARRVMENGALISEFPIGAQPLPANFPRRNRIVSGLALGVLVAEAPENSGALITATYAAEQGREVFAIPGSITSRSSAGANRLIQDGARLVMDVRDILDELDLAYEHVQTRVRTEQVAPSNDIERLLLDHLAADPIHIDELVRLSGLPVADITSALTIMELKGLAQMVGHMQYSRTNESG
ncbi:MAG: DNA-processing protein DprA [Chloroflexota bacterium]